MADRIDAAGIASSVNLVELVSRYRELTRNGNEYVAKCVDHAPDNNPSMTVSPAKGFVHCFSCGFHADAIAFLMHMERCTFLEACAKLTNGGTASLPPVIVQPQRELRKAPPRITFAPPPDAPPPDLKLRKLGEPSATWIYRTATGNVLGYVCRYDTDEGKEIRCFTWGQYTEAEPAGWLCKHWTAPRPLYGLDRLAARPGAQVLICEGEKATDAATRLFPGMVAVCWSGGANAYALTDWTPLKGRKVVLWPDADEPGRVAMLKLSVLLAKVGASEIKGINTEGYDNGWDAADSDLTAETALEWAKKRVFVYPVTQDKEADDAVSDDISSYPTSYPPLEAYSAAEAGTAERVAPEPRTQPAPNNAALSDSEAISYPANAAVTAASLGIVSRRLSDVTFRPVKWLWKDKIPCGKVSMIVGNPGLGKSQVCASLAAVITTGGRWPVTRDPAPHGSVIVLSAEDDADDTIGPRMEAAGADCSRIHMLDAIKTVNDNGEHITRGFDISHDINRLIILMHEIGDVRLVIIDPISAYLGILDSHKNSDVRGAMARLKDAASNAGAGVLIVNHLNKSQGQDALLKSQGSVGFVAAARAVWGVAKDKENPQRRLFMPLKNNLGTDETGLAYSIESHQLTDSDIHTSRVMWEAQAVEMSAEEVFAQHPDEEQNATTDAKAYLLDALANGPIKVSSLIESSRKAGHNWPTVKRAKQQLKVVSRRIGATGAEGSWAWELPSRPSARYGSRED